MATKESIKKNLGFQTAYQILNTCLPLITAPYLSRVLGADNLGVFSFTSSIVAYFALLAMLGTVNYGTRSIAASKENKKKLSQTFWGIYLLQILSTLVMLFLYILYLALICRDNKLIAVIQAIALVDCIFNINWLFFGLEKFKITVTRNFFIRILTVISILVLVRKPEDLWLYACIMLCGTLISNLILWIYLPGIVSFEKVSPHEVAAHLKPNLILFVPLLAMSVYHTMDKTMLGTLSNYRQSGYYYNADKIVNITVGIISGISTVMLPRMTSLISSGKKKESDALFKVSLEGTVIVGTAMAFGIAAIANEFEPLFFGPGYEECILLTIALAPVLIIKSFSFTARYQYLIPHNKEKEYIASVIAGVFVNLIANVLLIPGLGAMGAVLGTLLAELSACIWQYVAIGKYINIGQTLQKCAVYMFIGIIMFTFVRFVASIEVSIVIRIAIEIISGALLYAALCSIYWRVSGNMIYGYLFGTILNKHKA